MATNIIHDSMAQESNADELLLNQEPSKNVRMVSNTITEKKKLAPGIAITGSQERPIFVEEKEQRSTSLEFTLTKDRNSHQNLGRATVVSNQNNFDLNTQA